MLKDISIRTDSMKINCAGCDILQDPAKMIFVNFGIPLCGKCYYAECRRPWSIVQSFIQRDESGQYTGK